MSAKQSGGIDPQCLETYRHNLLLDADNDIFYSALFRSAIDRPTTKLDYLARKNSEDAVTWSVFRLLQVHFANQPWAAGLAKRAGCSLDISGNPDVVFWDEGCPSRERLLWLLENLDNPRVSESSGAKANPVRLVDLRRRREEYCRRVKQGQTCGSWVLEGPTQFDVILQWPTLLVAIEAKFGSDVSSSITWDTGRDQIARNIDAGRALAGDSDFVFLLVTDSRSHIRPFDYERLVPQYRRDSSSAGVPADRIGWITWSEICDWLEERQKQFTPDQRDWLAKLRKYLVDRSLMPPRA